MAHRAAGIDPDKDVEIGLDDGVLHIHAQRAERMEEKRPTGYRSELRYGGFHRDVRLPDGAPGSDVTATMKRGSSGSASRCRSPSPRRPGSVR